MNYYNEIKENLINNEIYKRVKDYSKNKSDLETYYKVGKLLAQAGKHYGEGIIKEYSKRLTDELGRGYSERNLRNMRQFQKVALRLKWQTMSARLSWSHYCEILWFEDEKINYYIKVCKEQNLSVRRLREKIKSKEYERLPESVENKTIEQNQYGLKDYIKNPILIHSGNNEANISEKALKQLILEDMDNFLLELGNDFSYIGNEYKIKIGDRYNYIDLLLYNIEFNCYVVVELKVTELKKEHIGQIQIYMNYIDNNLKRFNQDKTIGIIICKKDNKFIMEYCSDERIMSRKYELV